MQQPNLKRTSQAFESTKAHTLAYNTHNKEDFLDDKENQQSSRMGNKISIGAKKAAHNRHFFKPKIQNITLQYQKQQHKKTQQWSYSKGAVSDLVGSIIDHESRQVFSLRQKMPINQSYRLNPFKICTDAAMDWHPIVVSLYRQAQKKTKQEKVHFVYGILPDAGYLYYVIEKKLVLININQYIRSRNRCYASIFQVKQYIFAIKEVYIENQYIPSQFKQKMLLFSQPWKVSFYAYQINSRRVNLTFLDLSYNLLSCKVTVFDASEVNKIYYLDSKCQLNCLTIQDSFFVNLLSSKKYQIKNYRKKLNFFENKISFDRNWIKKGLMYFFKNIWMKIRSIFPMYDFPVSILNYTQLKLIVTLTIVEPLFVSNRLQRYIKVYSAHSDSFKSLRSIGQQQVYEMICSSINDTKQSFQIKQIYKVGPEQHIKADLAIVTNSLVRIYFILSQNGLKCCGINKPPQSQSIARELSREPEIKQQISIPSSQLQKQLFCSIKFQNKYVFGTKIRNKNKIRLLLFGLSMPFSNRYSIDQSNCQVFSIEWSNLKQQALNKVKDDSQEIVGIPEQSKLYSQSKHQTVSSDIKDVICRACKNLQKEQTQQNITNPFKSANELVLQAYFGPDQLIFCSDRKMSVCIFLRPIDTVFTIIQSTQQVEQAKLAIQKILPNLSQIDAICCLIQVLSDPYGIYYVSKKLKRAIAIYIQRQRIKKRAKFATQIINLVRNKEQFERVQTMESQYIQYFKTMIKSSKVYFIKELIRHFSNSIQPHQYINQLAKQDKHNQERLKALRHQGSSSVSISHDNKGRKGIHDAIIRCFSRIICIIWETSVTNVQIQLIKVLRNKIKSLLQCLDDLMVDISFGPKIAKDMFSQLKRFIKDNIQYLNLLEILFRKPYIKYHEFINLLSKSTEELIFQTFVAGFRPEILHQWSQSFPNLFTNQCKRVLKLYEITRNKNSKETLDILRQEKQLPQYFTEYLSRARNINQSDFIQKSQGY